MPRSAARTTRPPETDDFPYGWRYLKKVLPDGSVDLVEMPLTLEDVLHPQEGDVIPEREFQKRDADYLCGIFRQRMARVPGGFFLDDRLVNWGVPGIRNHSPDLSVFRDVVNPPRGNFGVFRLRPSGGRCVLVLEIVSPHTRENDVVHKVREYHRVGVPLYYLIDQETPDGPRWVVGYRYTKRRYVRTRPDRQGRLLVKPLGLWLAVENQFAVCYDADTGERIEDYTEMAEARQAAEERSRDAEERRRAAEERIRELEAELRRVRGAPPAS
jgi:Uma2 family endonuclease